MRLPDQLESGVSRPRGPGAAEAPRARGAAAAKSLGAREGKGRPAGPPAGESKALLRLEQLQRERGIEPASYQRPTAQRPLETMRSAMAATIPGQGDADVGADSPYLEAYRQMQSMEQVAPAQADPAQAGLAPAVLVPEGWRPIGPFAIAHGQTYGSGAGSRPGVSGRVSSIAVDPANPAHILIGAAGGGVWRSLDTGGTWSPRTDQQPSLAIGAVAFNPSNSQTVYAGTGEGDFYAWLGAGLLRSTDGGVTWNVHATTPFVGIGFYDLVVDPANGTHLLAATTAGLFESANGGTTWAARRATRTWDLSMVPGEVLAGCSDGVHRSTNGGTTWTSVALPGAPAAWVRIEVCHAPSSTGVAYVVAVGSAGGNSPWQGFIWRRATTGGLFTAVPFPAAINVGQGWYDWCAAVDPVNPAILYVAAIDLFKGNVTTGVWTNISAKGPNGDCIHPDQHHITFAPNNPQVVYAGCDGGIYRSPDGGVTWRSLNNGLCITEFEYLASHPNYDSWLLGGTQDNGTQLYEGGEVWLHVQDGDGGDCGIDATTPGTCFHTFFGMGMERSTTGGAWGSWSWVGPNVANTYQRLFYPPAEVRGGLVCQAGETAFISTNSGTTWIQIGLPANELATAIAIPNSTTIYVGMNSGKIVRINSISGVWQAAQALTTPRVGNVSDLAVDPTNAAILWATYSNVTGGHVYRSTNSGTVWTNVSASLPTIPVNAIAIDPAATNTVYVAADVGVYRSVNAGATWTAFNNQLPNALAADLVFHAADRLLRVGTRNRGVWEINVDRQNMPDVEVYVRDSKIDTGRRTPSPSGPDPFAPPAQTYWWESTDIKVDSPPFQTVNLTDVDFVRFEDDHGIFANGLLHENAERTKTVRVFVQVHNRGVQPATNVAVKVFFADASLGLPNLPGTFWTNFPNNSTGTSPWQPIAAHKTVASLQCGRPAVVGFNWAVPAGQAAHTCLLAVISAQNDSIATTELNVGTLVPGQQKCALKNLTVVNPLAVADPFVQLNVWRRLERDQYRIGTDPAGSEPKALILGRRLAAHAAAAGTDAAAAAGEQVPLRRRKVTAKERTALDKFLRDQKHIKPEEFDLENVFVPSRGALLVIPPGKVDQPDRLIVVLDEKMSAGRFALVQWDERGVPVGGYTFEVADKDPSKAAAGSRPTKKGKSK
jgi:hypothetical protein